MSRRARLRARLRAILLMMGIWKHDSRLASGHGCPLASQIVSMGSITLHWRHAHSRPFILILILLSFFFFFVLNRFFIRQIPLLQHLETAHVISWGPHKISCQGDGMLDLLLGLGLGPGPTRLEE
jgi:hypothetical protein